MSPGVQGICSKAQGDSAALNVYPLAIYVFLIKVFGGFKARIGYDEKRRRMENAQKISLIP